MTIDLSTLSPDQEKVLLQGFRYLRRRAAYLRARYAADTTQPTTTKDNAEINHDQTSTADNRQAG